MSPMQWAARRQKRSPKAWGGVALPLTIRNHNATQVPWGVQAGCKDSWACPGPSGLHMPPSTDSRYSSTLPPPPNTYFLTRYKDQKYCMISFM